VTESSLGGKWLELLREIAPRVVALTISFRDEQNWLRPNIDWRTREPELQFGT
jgi:hypothetical protein